MNVCLLELIQKGGMVHYASQMANALSSKKSMKINVIVPCGTDTNLFNNRIKIWTIPTISKYPYRLDTIMYYIWKINPDILHITIRHPLLLPILLPLKILGKKIVLTVHDVDPHSCENSVVIRISKKITYKFTDKFFVHGIKLKNDLIYKGISKNKIINIPHGDYSFFTNYTKQGLVCQENTILFFGRIKKYKGLDFLMKTEPIISNQIKNLKIIIAGEGDFSEYKKLICNKNNYEIYNEYIPNNIVAELFTRASVVVLPYIEASQSGVVPIAYAFNKPIISTDVGSLSEVVENGVTGIIVPPKDIKMLSDALLKILRNKSLAKKMGQAGNKKMKEMMSWDSIANTLIENYNQILKLKTDE